MPETLEAPARGAVDLLVVAGEHSGDQHAARMVRESLVVEPTLRVCAIGGGDLKAAGAQLLFDLTEASVVGLVEVLRHYGYFKRLFERVLSWISEYRPKAVCLVDYPGFNLRLAKALRERGVSVKGGGDVRVLYYISPQIWAWKQKRRFTMARDLDALAVIFPFEVECYADTQLPVTFVGHPFAEPDFVNPLTYSESGDVLLFPGSRRQAVGRIFPRLLGSFAWYLQNGGERSATVLFPDAALRAQLESLLEAVPPGVCERVRLRPREAGAQGAAVLTTSGTISLCCALAGIPGAITYVAHPLTYRFGRMVAKVEYLGMANLLLDKMVYPEHLQRAAKPARMGALLRDLLAVPSTASNFAGVATELHRMLGQERTMTAGQWLLTTMRA
ncbi:MAG: lipid-A-disaccharide synthase [Opitutales bacterium]